MLENALDLGITEAEFWNMTLAEIDRAAASKQRVHKQKLKERATFDYIHAQLIVRAMNATSENPVPELYEVYPTLFDEGEREQREEALQQQQQELSALRFIQFAESFNQKFDKEANE